MLSKVFASELFAMMIAMFLLLSVHAIFVRRTTPSEEQVVERFQDLSEMIGKKVLLELGKRDILNIPPTNTHLVQAMKDLKKSSDGFSGSMNAVIALLQKENVSSKEKGAAPLARDESDEEEEEDEEEAEEEHTVEGFIDANVHDYMSF